MRKKKELSVFSQRVRLAREECGLTQTALSEKMGNKNNIVSKLERIEAGAQGFPKYDTLVDLAKALNNVSLNWLCGINEPKVSIEDLQDKVKSEFSFLNDIWENNSKIFRIEHNLYCAEKSRSGIIVKDDEPIYEYAIVLKYGFLEKYFDDYSQISKFQSWKTLNISNNENNTHDGKDSLEDGFDDELSIGMKKTIKEKYLELLIRKVINENTKKNVESVEAETKSSKTEDKPIEIKGEQQ